ncbi:hypothetical protein [Actinomadura sp. 6K520]|uniref:hypothetical protein n=1 Tax=Actinomadura sp. 6K520 TaxID=2530364 RepID=UPI00104AA0E5|nr:hypothetical protein [Actinomadura sp. 6K520]TDE28610.1 hypothetical protein E1289_21385 [Actinomadura sp. 6K520]
MYAWIWRHLPGTRQTKTATALGIVIAVAAILWYLVFPWLEPKVQFDDGVVDTPTPTATP